MSRFFAHRFIGASGFDASPERSRGLKTKTTVFSAIRRQRESERRNLYPTVAEERQVRELIETLDIRQTQMQPPQEEPEPTYPAQQKSLPFESND